MQFEEDSIIVALLLHNGSLPHGSCAIALLSRGDGPFFMGLKDSSPELSSKFFQLSEFLVLLRFRI